MLITHEEEEEVQLCSSSCSACSCPFLLIGLLSLKESDRFWESDNNNKKATGYNKANHTFKNTFHPKHHKCKELLLTPLII